MLQQKGESPSAHGAYLTNAVAEPDETSLNPFPIHSNQAAFQSVL